MAVVITAKPLLVCMTQMSESDKTLTGQLTERPLLHDIRGFTTA